MFEILAGFISIAKTALAVIIAHRNQRRRVTGAILERQASYTWWELPCMRDFWEVTVPDFTEQLWIQTFRMTRSTFEAMQ